MRLLLASLGLIAALLLAGCHGVDQAPRAVTVPQAAFFPEKLAAMDAAINEAITNQNCPGGVLWLEHRGSNYHRAYGRRAVVPAAEPMTEDTIFDVASLTKVLATAPAIMKLIERGQIKLDAPAVRYLPGFKGHGKEEITIRHLLTHTSGLRPGLSRSPDWSGADKAIELACAESLPNPPGTTFRYSDINFIVLGEIVRRVSGKRLDEFCAQEFYRPLQMRDTAFRPMSFAGGVSELVRIAPTEKQADGTVLRGTVHDPTSRRMGGVAGHAGVFSTAADLARFARMLLNGGELDGVRVLKPETIKLMTSVQTAEAVPARRGLGWDIDSPYAGPRGKHFPLGSYGHTGWTGTSVWIDPFSQTFVIFLSNRNHPSEDGSVLALRRSLGTLAAEAVIGFNWDFIPGALPVRPDSASSAVTGGNTALVEVLNGIDVLERDGFKPLQGLKVGLITNHTGIDRARRSTIDLLKEAAGVELKALFSPEHGIRGELDAKVSDGVDARTGLPIHSLYGERRSPTTVQLAGLDALVFDIQDIGCRFYTYISTLGECLQAAAAAKKKFIVLDRVNPITGGVVDGPLLTAPRSFTAWHELPVRHGMTVGELARMFNVERHLEASLTVVPCEGWNRELWFDQTGLPWINTSPNLRSLTQATLYPGLGLIEQCRISVGRGTPTPFELVGAPYVNDRKLAEALNQRRLGGVRFVPVRFTPTASVFSGEECGGVQILVTDRLAFNPLDLGVVLADVLNRLHPDRFAVDRMQTLLGDAVTLASIREGRALPATRAEWKSGHASFLERRERFLLYH